MFKYIPVSGEMVRWVVESLKDANIIQVNFAKGAGLSQGFASSIMRGDQKAVTPAIWEKIKKFLDENGAKPFPENLDPIHQAPNEALLRKELKQIKESTKSGWTQIAQTCNVRVNVLSALMGKKDIGWASLIEIRNGVDRLKGLPAKVQKDGVVGPTITKPMVKTQKKSVVSMAPAETLFTEEALDMRELQILDRIRARISQSSGKILNGARQHK